METTYIRMRHERGGTPVVSNAPKQITVPPSGRSAAAGILTTQHYTIGKLGLEVPRALVRDILNGRSGLEEFTPDEDTLKRIAGEPTPLKFRAYLKAKRDAYEFEWPSSRVAQARGAPEPCRIAVGLEWTEVHEDVALFAANHAPGLVDIRLEPTGA